MLATGSQQTAAPRINFGQPSKPLGASKGSARLGLWRERKRLLPLNQWPVWSFVNQAPHKQTAQCNYATQPLERIGHKSGQIESRSGENQLARTCWPLSASKPTAADDSCLCVCEFQFQFESCLGSSWRSSCVSRESRRSTSGSQKPEVEPEKSGDVATHATSSSSPSSPNSRRQLQASLARPRKSALNSELRAEPSRALPKSSR